MFIIIIIIIITVSPFDGSSVHLREGYINIYTSYAMLSSGIPWNMSRVTCIFRIHTSL